MNVLKKSFTKSAMRNNNLLNRIPKASPLMKFSQQNFFNLNLTNKNNNVFIRLEINKIEKEYSSFNKLNKFNFSGSNDKYISFYFFLF